MATMKTRYVDSAFFNISRGFFPAAIIEAHSDEQLHNHGSSTIKYGRGAVAHSRSNESLQHDVRPMLHGMQSSGVRA